MKQIKCFMFLQNRQIIVNNMVGHATLVIMNGFNTYKSVFMLFDVDEMSI